MYLDSLNPLLQLRYDVNVKSRSSFQTEKIFSGIHFHLKYVLKICVKKCLFLPK